MTKKNWKAGSIYAGAMLAAAVASSAIAADKPVIYVIAPSLSDPFWITQQNGANQAAKDFGVDVVFQAPAQDTGDAGMVPLVAGGDRRQARGHCRGLHFEDDGRRHQRPRSTQA